ncbi:MAG: hypothetical protein ACI8RD_012526, partial [Bacillariaceae sp.]|jgi:hypothetical protein
VSLLLLLSMSLLLLLLLSLLGPFAISVEYVVDYVCLRSKDIVLFGVVAKAY